MKIQLDKLKKGPQEIFFEEPVSGFPALVHLFEHEQIGFAGPISGKLKAVWVDDLIHVTGSLSVSIELSCSRCLDDMTLPYEIPVSLVYAESPDANFAEAETDQELTEKDLVLLPIKGDELDMRPELEYEIIMSLPVQPLCSATCQGLCPVCGCNWNRSRCKCEPPVFHSGLEALKKLKID